MFIFHIQSVGPAPIKTVVKDVGEMGGGRVTVRDEMKPREREGRGKDSFSEVVLLSRSRVVTYRGRVTFFK